MSSAKRKEREGAKAIVMFFARLLSETTDLASVIERREAGGKRAGGAYYPDLLSKS